MDALQRCLEVQLAVAADHRSGELWAAAAVAAADSDRAL